MHFPFDPSFQRHIIASFLEKSLGEGEECLREEFFEDEVTGGIAESVRDFYLKEKEPPTKEAVIHEIKDRVAPGRKLQEYVEAIEDIYEKVGHNGEYYRSKAREFVRSKEFSLALKESYNYLEMGDYDKAVARVKVSALQNGTDPKIIYQFLQGIEGRAMNYFNSHHGNNPEKRVSTGFALLDERLQGGLGPGETGVFVAPPKHGKTTILVSLAAHCLFQKKKVLYVTLELNHKVISSKFDSNILGEPLENLKRKPKTFRDDMFKVCAGLKEGCLWIAEFPPKTLTVYGLQELIEKEKPEIVFIDYAMLLRPFQSKQDRRFELSDIHESLRAVAGLCKVPIWTAHQANRPSLGRRRIDMDNIAEDFNIAAICDVALSINQSEEEQREGTLRLYIMGNRLGALGDSFECKVSWELSRIRPLMTDSDLK